MAIAHESEPGFDPTEQNKQPTLFDELIQSQQAEATSADQQTNYFDAPESEPQLPQEDQIAEKKQSNGNLKRFVLLGGSALAGAALTVGLLTLRDSDRELTNNPNQETVAADAPAPQEPGEPNLPTTPERGTKLPYDSNTVLGIVNVTENDILVERPGGRKMYVPHLTAASPSEFADSFLTQYACYATTGDNACAMEITTEPDVREAFIRGRKSFEIAEFQSDPLIKNLQLQIYGKPFFLSGEVVDPEHGQAKYIELDPSTELNATVHMGGTEQADVWQGHEVFNGIDYRFGQFRVVYTVDQNNKPNVIHFKMEATTTN